MQPPTPTISLDEARRRYSTRQPKSMRESESIMFERMVDDIQRAEPFYAHVQRPFCSYPNRRPIDMTGNTLYIFHEYTGDLPMPDTFVENDHTRDIVHGWCYKVPSDIPINSRVHATRDLMLGPEPMPWFRLDGSRIERGDPDFIDDQPDHAAAYAAFQSALKFNSMQPPPVDDLDIDAPLHSMLMGPPATGMSTMTDVHMRAVRAASRAIQADKNEYAAYIEQRMMDDEAQQFQQHLAALSEGKRRFERYSSAQATAATHPVEKVVTKSPVYMGMHSTPAIIDAYVRYTYADTGGRDSSSITIHRGPNQPPAGAVYYRSGPDDDDNDADEPPPIAWIDTDEPPPLEWDIESVLCAFPDEMVERPTEHSLAMARQMLTNLSKYCVQTGPDTSLLGHVDDIHWTNMGRCWITFKNGLNMFQEYEDPESWFVVEKACTTRKLGGVRGLASCVLFACFNDKHDH